MRYHLLLVSLCTVAIGGCGDHAQRSDQDSDVSEPEVDSIAGDRNLDFDLRHCEEVPTLLEDRARAAVDAGQASSVDEVLQEVASRATATSGQIDCVPVLDSIASGARGGG